MNDTVDSQSSNPNGIRSPNWVRPNDVMKTRKLKAKRHALRARLSNSQPLQVLVQSKDKDSEKTEFASVGVKRRNPFQCAQSKTIKLSSENDSSENSSDCSLLQLFNSQPNVKLKSKEPCDFSELFSTGYGKKPVIQSISNENWSKVLQVDWSLKSRLRFQSPKPIQWKHTFKTSEEASGTTGFIRCLSSDAEDAGGGRTLDTSTNAQFYQCCLLWQHPSLPLVSLFPRDKQKISAQTGIFGTDQKIINSLHTEWAESLRSLYQLLRVRQCAFFYVCAHSFTCLFRAAGAAGFPHTHALITPTTNGFRHAMRKEGVEFTMPFYTKSSQTEEEEEEGEGEDVGEVVKDDETEEEEEEEEPTVFLETLGLETSQFPSLNQSRVTKESKQFQSIDGSSQSLVSVSDVELQGLINFLLNCATCVSNTGPLAGVPPTLLAPVGFHGGTLKSLKISGGPVRTPKGETEYSVDIRGPILPSTVLNLCSLLSTSSDTFAASLTPLISTVSFSSITPSVTGSSVPMAFANEGLIDCGLKEQVRTLLCNSADNSDDDDTKLPNSYREIKYQNSLYTWTAAAKI